MRQKDEGKVEQIYNATLKLVLENGLAGVTMYDISKAAGIATGTLYIYFTNKEELITVLFSVCRKESAAFYLKDYKEDEPFEASFKKIFMNITEYRLLYFEKYIFLEQCYHSPFISQEIRKNSLLALHPLFLLLEKGKREKKLKVIDNNLLLSFIFGAINEVVKKKYYAMKKMDKSTLESLYELCRDGIKA